MTFIGENRSSRIMRTARGFVRTFCLIGIFSLVGLAQAQAPSYETYGTLDRLALNAHAVTIDGRSYELSGATRISSGDGMLPAPPTALSLDMTGWKVGVSAAEQGSVWKMESMHLIPPSSSGDKARGR